MSRINTGKLVASARWASPLIAGTVIQTPTPVADAEVVAWSGSIQSVHVVSNSGRPSGSVIHRSRIVGSAWAASSATSAATHHGCDAWGGPLASQRWESSAPSNRLAAMVEDATPPHEPPRPLIAPTWGSPDAEQKANRCSSILSSVSSSRRSADATTPSTSGIESASMMRSSSSRRSTGAPVRGSTWWLHVSNTIWPSLGTGWSGRRRESNRSAMASGRRTRCVTMRDQLAVCSR